MAIREYVRLPAQWTIALPDGLSLRESMILGTAGFTAALALLRMEDNRQTPALGPLAVTGATGGVGSLAVEIFSRAGYDVHAISGKPDAAAYLRALGATEILSRDALATTRPMETARFGGGLDNVGGAMLTSLLAQTAPYGNVASAGLAASHALDATVMPFIIRGVSLLGVASAGTARDIREEVWRRLASRLETGAPGAHLHARSGAGRAARRVRHDARRRLVRPHPGDAVTEISHVRLASWRSPARMRRDSPGTPMARILIVDDSPSQLMGIRRIVEKLGHEALTAEDGAAGVEAAKRELPDLILMDVVMPNLNGFQATRSITREATTKHIPIVLVTTKDQDTDRVWGMRQGAKAYITKPFSESELADMIQQMLGGEAPPAPAPASEE